MLDASNKIVIPPRARDRGFEPKYLLVKRLLTDRIRSGRLAVGDRIPSQHELSATCRVSGNTCKRAVQSLVEDGILEGEQGRGVFVRSTFGRSDVRQIALVAWIDEATSSHPAFAAVIQGLMSALAQTGYQLSFTFLAPDQLHADQMQARMARIHAAGIIITHTPGDVQAALEPLVHKDVPIVSIGRLMERLSPHAVLTDTQGGLARLVDAALASGVRRMALLGCPLDDIFQRRMNVFRECFERAGRSLDEFVIRRGEATHEVGRRLMRELLESDAPRPDLVIGDDDYVAYGALDALHQAGLDAPRDMQVLGVGGFLNASLSLPRLSTFCVPFADSGERAGRMMIDLIESRPLDDPAPVLPCPIEYHETFTVPVPSLWRGALAKVRETV